MSQSLGIAAGLESLVSLAVSELREGLATSGTCERLVSGMDSKVLFQGRWSGELESTD